MDSAKEHHFLLHSNLRVQLSHKMRENVFFCKNKYYLKILPIMDQCFSLFSYLSHPSVIILTVIIYAIFKLYIKFCMHFISFEVLILFTFLIKRMNFSFLHEVCILHKLFMSYLTKAKVEQRKKKISTSNGKL